MLTNATLREGDRVRIGDAVLVVLEVRHGPYGWRARLGFEADPSIQIDRSEVRERKQFEREAGA
jgi:sRNA-binding carbon storage regulator CsrA